MIDKNNLYYCPLSLSLIPESVKYSGVYSETTPVDAYSFVLKPLLDASIEAYVYKGRNERFYLYGKWNHPVDLETIPFLMKERGKYRIDIKNAEFSGYEYFWNAWAFKRGSIVILLPKDFDFSPLFSEMYAPELMENPNTGNTASAAKKCRQEISNDVLSVLFSASNGIEHLCIYTDIKHRDSLLSLAEKTCKKCEKDE